MYYIISLIALITVLCYIKIYIQVQDQIVALLLIF